MYLSLYIFQVCPVSSKVHTTQTKADAIYCENDTQLIFIDTPGVVSMYTSKRYKLTGCFREDPKGSLAAADVVGIVQEANNIYTRHKIDKNILELLTGKIVNRIPIILIFNKVDKLRKKEMLLQLVDTLIKSEKSFNFSDIFMVSALTEDGIDDLRVNKFASVIIKCI